MKNNIILKFLIFSLCVVLILCLAACKGGAAPDGTDSSDGTQQNVQSGESVVTDTSGNNTEDNSTDKKPSSNRSALQGVELEEDIFDYSDINSNASSGNTSSNSSGTSSDNQSQENESDSNSSDSDVSEEITSSDDGTVKLPVDWFD